MWSQWTPTNSSSGVHGHGHGGSKFKCDCEITCWLTSKIGFHWASKWLDDWFSEQAIKRVNAKYSFNCKLIITNFSQPLMFDNNSWSLLLLIQWLQCIYTVGHKKQTKNVFSLTFLKLGRFRLNLVDFFSNTFSTKQCKQLSPDPSTSFTLSGETWKSLMQV